MFPVCGIIFHKTFMLSVNNTTRTTVKFPLMLFRKCLINVCVSLLNDSNSISGILLKFYQVKKPVGSEC